MNSEPPQRPGTLLVILLLLLPFPALASPEMAEATSLDFGLSRPFIAYLLVAGGALLLNGLFTVAQTSSAAIGPFALEKLEEDKSFLSVRARRYLHHLPRLEQRFAAGSLFMLLLMSFCLAMAGALSLPTTRSIGAVSGVLIALLLQVILIEVIARTMALANPVRYFRSLVPLAYLLSFPSALFLIPMRLLRASRPGEGRPMMALSDMHLRLFPSLRGVERVLDEEAFEMIDSVRDFTETTAEDIMTPRTEVEGIRRDLPVDQVYERLRQSAYSRLVVYEDSLDHVIGTLLVKEVLLQRPADPFTLLRESIIASEKMRLPELLDLIRTNRSHLVLIVDEYNGLSGIVTLHDLFEVIVGHIEDIEDEDELWIDKLDDKQYRLNGRVEIWEVNEETGLTLDEETVRTIGGLIFHTLGRPAMMGDEVEVGGARLRVEEARENRVEIVQLEMISPAEVGTEEKD